MRARGRFTISQAANFTAQMRARRIAEQPFMDAIYAAKAAMDADPTAENVAAHTAAQHAARVAMGIER